MSGHSKWATTKRKKFLIDAKKSAVFTKLANAISVAARACADPTANFSLRMAIDQAKSFSLPKENIERAIKRGAGNLGEAFFEETTYEGFGPGNVAIIVECLTDNKNRTYNEIKIIFDKHCGALAAPGSVMWNFERKGVITILNTQLAIPKEKIISNNSQDSNSQNLQLTELKIIDAGADDFIFGEEENELIIYTKTEDLQKVKENLDKIDFKVKSAGLEYVAKEKISLSSENEEKLQNLLMALDEQNEVGEYYTNTNG